MQEVLALALGSMQNDMRRLDQVGMNLANAVTPGYKRGMVVQQGSTPFAAAMDAAAAASVTTGAAAPLVSMATDARTGTLKGTGQSLDIATEAKDRAQQSLSNAASTTTRYVSEQPLRSVLIAAAVGAGIALLVSSARHRNQNQNRY